MVNILWQGDFYRLNSFSIVNQKLTAAIIKRGFSIMRAPTDRFKKIDLEETPDIYVFHNYPYDVIQAPGNFNIFYLPYEYFEFYDRDYFLAEGINAQFDMMVVPSNFTKKACENSGVKIPIRVIPEGYDPKEFNPNIPPEKLDTDKNFKFLNLGGAFFRKGHDLLVSAYLEEFTDFDDVVLVIKAFSYHQELDWVKEILTRQDQMENPPEILFEHSEMDQIAGFYTATDVGVYPYRGEGYGLTILESIACGCPVIVTDGGSTDDFCNSTIARFIKARKKNTEGKIHLEPSISSIRGLMREAYEEGKISDEMRETINHESLAFTWEESAIKWEALFHEILEKKTEFTPANNTHKNISLIYSNYDDQISPWKEYTPQQKRIDTVSPWKESKPELITALSKFSYDVQIIELSNGRTNINECETIIGDSGFSYEYFSLMKKLNSHTNLMLFHDQFPLELSFELEHRERKLLGIDYQEHPRYQSLLYWRYQQEIKMANDIILLDSISEKFFSKKHKSLITHSVVPPIPQYPFIPTTNNTITYLFWGFDPFRRGIRILFEAWNKLQLENAELVCILETKIALASKQLLQHLVVNPSIKIMELGHSNKYIEYLSNCDIQVLPSLGDGFFLPAAIGLSKGKPLITSDQSGMKDIIKDNDFGHIVKSNSIKSLADGILHYYEINQSRRNEIGRVASKHMEKYSKENFAQQIVKTFGN